MSYRNLPLSEDPTTGDYWVDIAAANGIPSGTGTVHATYAPTTGTEVAKVRRAPRKIQIQGYFTGSDKVNATWVCAYWSYNPDTAVWVSSELFSLVGTTDRSATLGQVKNLDHDPNARYGYVEVLSGVDPNQALEVTIVAQEW